MKTKRLATSALALGILLVGGLASSAGPKAAATKPAKAAATTRPAKAETRKKQDIRRLLVITGSGKVGIQVIDSMITQFQGAFPGIPDEFWREFRKEADANAMVELIIPIYDRHFTHKDIRGLIAFYESPLGKKFVSKTPQIVKESMVVGQKWGMELGKRAMKKIQDRKKKLSESGTDF